MVADLEPIRSETDYEKALAEFENLWGAKASTQRQIGSIFWRPLSTATKQRPFPRIHRIQWKQYVFGWNSKD
jgi:hypothetical protein